MHEARTGGSPAGRDGNPVPVTGRLGAFDAWQAMSAAWEVWTDSAADAATIERRARGRLSSLLRDSTGSPLYRRLHAAATARADVPLTALPPVTRGELMAGFDEWCTDRSVTHAAADAFLADPSRAGEAFLGRYAIWTSSGTTGTPGIYVHDARALAVYDALEMLRFRRLSRPAGVAETFTRLATAPWSGGERFAMLGATGGHFAGNASVERVRRIAPWAVSRVRMISIMQPLEAIVAELELFRPTVLATYPTAAELLAGEQAAGRLRLELDELWFGGEQLSDSVRGEVEQAFGCRVRNAYGASEFMAIGWDCSSGSLHVNSDYVLLEPVDRRMRPVPAGQTSHTVLLTNLVNRVQPLIRYDLGDAVTMLPRCRCGSAFPAVHVEGRSDDVLEFAAADGSGVSLLPLALVTVLEDDAGVFDFQLVQTDARTLVLKLGATADAAGTRRTCRRVLQRFLAGHRVGHVRIVDGTEPPTRHPISGKLRRIVRADGDRAAAGAGTPPRMRRL